MKNYNKAQKGFTILIAVITAGILLVVAMSIAGIAIKEQILSTSNRDSQIAFYAADTGMECTLYLDQQQGAFAPNDTITGYGNMVSPSAPANNFYKCNGSFISFTPVAGRLITGTASDPHSRYQYTFKIDGIPVGDPNSTVKTCAVVTIEKETNACTDPDPSDPSLCNGVRVTSTHTTVHSNGYNTCQPSLTRLERGIVANY